MFPRHDLCSRLMGLKQTLPHTSSLGHYLAVPILRNISWCGSEVFHIKTYSPRSGDSCMRGAGSTAAGDITAAFSSLGHTSIGTSLHHMNFVVLEIFRLGTWIRSRSFGVLAPDSDGRYFLKCLSQVTSWLTIAKHSGNRM